MDGLGAREKHINFVSNHNGSFPSDIILSTLPAPLSVALTSVVLPLLLPTRYVLLQYCSRIWIHLLIETLTVVCPILLSFTLLSCSTVLNPIILLLLITSLMICAPKWWNLNIPVLNRLFSFPLPGKKPSFLTNYRAGMNLATAICILAVDFSVFPRRFAKTETYGYSLMDVGVGSFVIANGLVGSSQNQAAKAWSKSFPLLLLGIFRLIAVKLSNYHEHVTEYGVHWNFFFTLAVVKVAPSLIKTNLRPIVLSFALLAIYELGLKLGLETWILSDYPRNNLISANREGIFSLLGYMALYYASCELGDYIKISRTLFKEWLRLLMVLICLSFLGWICLHCCESLLGIPSRRLANTSFCLWMLTYNLIIMATYLLVDLLLVTFDIQQEIKNTADTSSLPVFREPYLLRFINYNGLAFFLLANFLTGIVNMTFDTIHMTPMASVVLLFSYCTVLCLCVAGMYLWRMRI